MLKLNKAEHGKFIFRAFAKFSYGSRRQKRLDETKRIFFTDG